jgi:hypothetical protein
MKNFIIGFYGICFAPSIGQTPEGNVPRAKDLRSPELQSDLKLAAVMKRANKANKRKWDAIATVRGQYNNHYQTN